MLMTPAACDRLPTLVQSRDARLRRLYLAEAEAAVPRILASVDRNAFGPTYGCCDLQYWHYRTAAFPSEMYQEAALPLAQAFAIERPGKRWFGEMRLAEAAIAVMRFSARSAHRDGSCDDYYPFERALGAAVFSLVAQTEAYKLLEPHDTGLLRFFARRAEWIAAHDESGRLANHHALAALAMFRASELVDSIDLRRAALVRIERLIDWQSSEGWFDEYGGADPGYQTVTIECLAKLRRESGLPHLNEVLRRAAAFARPFVHLDDGYGGVYGSRGTRHFYPGGCELMAATDANAADLADAYLRSLEKNRAARFDDDRMYVHRTASLFAAYDHWAPRRIQAQPQSTEATIERFDEAGLLVLRAKGTQAIVSTARGGTFQAYHDEAGGMQSVVDAGLVVEFANGRMAVSQTHDRTQAVEWNETESSEDTTFSTVRPLRWAKFERATPLRQAVLHVGMTTVGRFARGLVRKFLQRRVIAQKGAAPLEHTRSFAWKPSDAGAKLVVTDVLRLTDAAATVQRLAFASDLQAAYTAAANAGGPALLQPWFDLNEEVTRLNRERSITVVRELS
jgi:hypothetical protein